MRRYCCSASAANFLFSKLRVLGGDLVQLLCQHGGAGSSTDDDCAALISCLARRSALCDFIAERESLSEAAWRERRVIPPFRSSHHEANVVYINMESNARFGPEDLF